MRPVAESLEIHQAAIAPRLERFAELYETVDSKHNLPLETWAPLFALAVDLGPDLIIELGRGRGNSTCVFAEVAQEISTRVVSIGFDGGDGWTSWTRPRIEPIVDAAWFEPLTILDQDILAIEFAPIVREASRVLLFWDAHGMAVADAVFERLIPLLPAGSEVVVHDIADAVEHSDSWEFRVGPFGSMFDELLPIWDLIERERLPYSGDFCLRFGLPG